MLLTQPNMFQDLRLDNSDRNSSILVCNIKVATSQIGSVVGIKSAEPFRWFSLQVIQLLELFIHWKASEINQTYCSQKQRVWCHGLLAVTWCPLTVKQTFSSSLPPLIVDSTTSAHRWYLKTRYCSLSAGPGRTQRKHCEASVVRGRRSGVTFTSKSHSQIIFFVI